MLTIYTVSNCTRCRKTKEWFRKNEIPFVEKRLDVVRHLSKEEIFLFLGLTEGGFEDIIAKRSKEYTCNFTDLNNLTTNEVVQILTHNNALVRTPILYDGKKVQFGTNEDGFRKFIPRERKKATTMFYLGKLLNVAEV